MASPLIDIVVLVHDQPKWVDLCIRAVEHHTANPYRLILVDNASKEDETKAMLLAAERRGHTIVRLAENRSFSSGMNAGVNVGTSKFIILLNSDALPTEGWDTALLQDASEKFTGLVGARSNYVSGPQGDPSFIGEPPYLVFVCVALRRDIWNIVGPMDEATFDGFSSEDLDYSWLVKKAGYKLKISNAFVLHAGSRTLAATVGDALERQRNDAKYNARLKDKWGKEWIAKSTKLAGNVLVNTYSAEEWCRVEFMRSVLGLKRSDGVGFSFHSMTRAPIHMARQLVCDYALDNGFDWLVQLDDDATFPTDLIRRLMAHQKDIVCALAYQRKPPHLTCCFEKGEDGLLGTPMEDIEHTGLRRVDISGFHCSIMHTSVIKKMRDAGIRQYWGGFDNKLGEDFAFPVAPETPVLGIDWSWRPITAYKSGDVVIGFDEQSPANSSRRFVPATVTGLIRKTLPRVRIVTDENEIITTAEHPWLSNNSLALARSYAWKWRPSGVLKPGMVVAAVTPFESNPDVHSPDYAAGYVQGIFHSDGYHSKHHHKNSTVYEHFIVKMKDVEPLERLSTLLALLGIESRRGAVSWDGNLKHAPMHKVGVERRAFTAKMNALLGVTSIPSQMFAAGYLAGKYDGDGSHYGGGLFIHSKVDWKKDRLEEAARIVGVPFTARDDRHVRICGQDNIFKFWQMVNPALTRRMSLLGQKGNDGIQRGKEIKHRPVVIHAIEALPPEEVFCLTTTSSTFVARGLASHNCINAGKVGIQIHADTGLISGHIGAAIVVDEAYKQKFIAGKA